MVGLMGTLRHAVGVVSQVSTGQHDMSMSSMSRHDRYDSRTTKITQPPR
jgi:hypothetical protein